MHIGWILLIVAITVTAVVIATLVCVDFSSSRYNCVSGSDLNTTKSVFRDDGNMKSEVDIVISLTTLPHRVDTVLPIMLKSVEDQTVRPRSVEINLPRTTKNGDTYVVPNWLQRMHDGGAVTVYRVDDKGPATKYIPTLERYVSSPHQLILVVDDDMVLDQNRVAEFYAASKTYPNDVLAGHIVSVNRGTCEFDVMKFEDSTPNAIAVLTSNKTGVGKPGDIVTGFQNYLIQPRFFDITELFDYDKMPKEAFYVDDVVISGHLARRGVIRRVPPGTITGMNKLPDEHFWKHVLSFITTPNTENLSTGANRGDHNNNVMVKYFSDVWC